jgi:hypothetical protein
MHHQRRKEQKLMQNPILPPIDIAALKEVISGEAKKLRHLQHAEKALQDLDRLNQHISEKQDLADKLKNHVAEAQAVKDAANEYANDLRKQAADEKRSADAQKSELLAHAAKDADKIKADARAEAKEHVEEAAKLVSGHVAKADELKAANDAVDKDLEAKKTELEALEKKLSDHKTSLAEFLK